MSKILQILLKKFLVVISFLMMYGMSLSQFLGLYGFPKRLTQTLVESWSAFFLSRATLEAHFCIKTKTNGTKSLKI